MSVLRIEDQFRKLESRESKMRSPHNQGRMDGKRLVRDSDGLTPQKMNLVDLNIPPSRLPLVARLEAAYRKYDAMRSSKVTPRSRASTARGGHSDGKEKRYQDKKNLENYAVDRYDPETALSWNAFELQMNTGKLAKRRPELFQRGRFSTYSKDPTPPSPSRVTIKAEEADAYIASLAKVSGDFSPTKRQSRPVSTLACRASSPSGPRNTSDEPAVQACPSGFQGSLEHEFADPFQAAEAAIRAALEAFKDKGVDPTLRRGVRKVKEEKEKSKGALGETALELATKRKSLYERLQDRLRNVEHKLALFIIMSMSQKQAKKFLDAKRNLSSGALLEVRDPVCSTRKFIQESWTYTAKGEMHKLALFEKDRYGGFYRRQVPCSDMHQLVNPRARLVDTCGYSYPHEFGKRSPFQNFRVTEKEAIQNKCREGVPTCAHIRPSPSFNHLLYGNYRLTHSADGIELVGFMPAHQTPVKDKITANEKTEHFAHNGTKQLCGEGVKKETFLSVSVSEALPSLITEGLPPGPYKVGNSHLKYDNSSRPKTHTAVFSQVGRATRIGPSRDGPWDDYNRPAMGLQADDDSYKPPNHVSFKEPSIERRLPKIPAKEDAKPRPFSTPTVAELSEKVMPPKKVIKEHAPHPFFTRFPPCSSSTISSFAPERLQGPTLANGSTRFGVAQIGKTPQERWACQRPLENRAVTTYDPMRETRYAGVPARV